MNRMTPPTTLRTDPLRKARSLLRKSGRDVAVAFLKAEVEEMADVSPEMAGGIASDALDGDDAVLQQIMDLLGQLGITPDGQDPSASGAGGPFAEEMPPEEPIEDPMMDDPMTSESGQIGPAEGSVGDMGSAMQSPQDGMNSAEPPPETMMGMNSGPHGDAPYEDPLDQQHSEPGDRISPEEPQDPDRMQKTAGRGSAEQPASNADPEHSDSSPQPRPVSINAPVVGQLERAPKPSQEQASMKWQARFAKSLVEKKKQAIRDIELQMGSASPHIAPGVGEGRQANRSGQGVGETLGASSAASMLNNPKLKPTNTRLGQLSSKLPAAANAVKKPLGAAGAAVSGMARQMGNAMPKPPSGGGMGFVPKTPMARPPSQQKRKAPLAKGLFGSRLPPPVPSAQPAALRMTANSRSDHPPMLQQDASDASALAFGTKPGKRIEGAIGPRIHPNAKKWQDRLAKSAIPKLGPGMHMAYGNDLNDGTPRGARRGYVPETAESKRPPTRHVGTPSTMKGYGGAGGASRSEAIPPIDGRGDTIKSESTKLYGIDGIDANPNGISRNPDIDPILTEQQWGRQDETDRMMAEPPYIQQEAIPHRPIFDLREKPAIRPGIVPGVLPGEETLDVGSRFDEFRLENKWQQRLAKAGGPPATDDPNFRSLRDSRANTKQRIAKPPSVEVPENFFEYDHASHTKEPGGPGAAAERAFQRRQQRVEQEVGQGPVAPQALRPKPQASPAEQRVVPATEMDPESFAAPAQAERPEDLPDFALRSIAPRQAGVMPQNAPATVADPRNKRATAPRGRPPKFAHLRDTEPNYAQQMMESKQRAMQRGPKPMRDTPSRQEIGSQLDTKDPVNSELQHAIWEKDLDKVMTMVDSGVLPKEHAVGQLWNAYEMTFDPDIEHMLTSLGWLAPEAIESRKQDLISPMLVYQLAGKSGVSYEQLKTAPVKDLIDLANQVYGPDNGLSRLIMRRGMRIPQNHRGAPPGFETYSKDELKGLLGTLQQDLASSRSSGERPSTGHSIGTMKQIVNAIDRYLNPQTQMTERFDPSKVSRGSVNQRISRSPQTREAMAGWKGQFGTEEQGDMTTEDRLKMTHELQMERELAENEFHDQFGIAPHNYLLEKLGREPTQEEIDDLVLTENQRTENSRAYDEDASANAPAEDAYTIGDAFQEMLERRKGKGRLPPGVKTAGSIWKSQALKAQLGESLAAGESAMSKHRFANIGAKEPLSPSERYRKHLHHTQKAVVQRLMDLNELRKAAHG